MLEETGPPLHRQNTPLASVPGKQERNLDREILTLDKEKELGHHSTWRLQAFLWFASFSEYPAFNFRMLQTTGEMLFGNLPSREFFI